jgi:hypothetical protein
MGVLIILGLVVLGLVLWGLRHDLRQRRLGGTQGHDVSRAAARARGESDRHGGMGTSDGGPGA